MLRLGLRPLAEAAAQPDAFWRGGRLVALDGTQFSLTNTPQVKAATRRSCVCGPACATPKARRPGN